MLNKTKEFLNNNFKTLAIVGLVIPIIFFSFISSYHLIAFFSLTNPLFLSIIIAGVLELTQLASIGGLAVLKHISSKVLYSTFLFIVIIQFFGNIFYGFDYASQKMEKDPNHLNTWSELVGYKYVTDTTIKRFLTIVSNGFFPVLSLAFTHLLFNYVHKLNSDDTETDYNMTNVHVNYTTSSSTDTNSNDEIDTDDKKKVKK